MEQLPLISLAGLYDSDPTKRHEIAENIGNAAREIGFFRICDHGIDLDLIEATYKAAENFFAQPDDYKQQYYIGNSRNHRGYVPFTEKGDYPDEKNRSYEAFDLGLDLPANDPDYLAGKRVLGPNVWPDLPGFQATVGQYYNRIAALGHSLCGCLEIFLGLPEKTITRHMTKPISQLRLLHYVRQSATTEHKSVNMGAHNDYECLTLLHTRNKGLQVMDQNDNWIDVPVDPSVFVINIGDMLEAWSNGILRSTPHRVTNLSPERFSLPYFVAADYDALIKPFPQLVSDARPARYEPFRAGEHLENMLIRDFPYLRDKIPQPEMGGAPTMGTYHNPFETRFNSAKGS